MLSFNLGDCGVVSNIIIKIYTPIIVYPKNTCKIFGSNMSIEQVCHERAYTFSQKMSNEASLNVHSQKMARLVAHHWKKLKFSMGILTFFAIPNKFRKGTGSVWSFSSQLSHKVEQIWSIKIRAQFPCSLDICKF